MLSRHPLHRPFPPASPSEASRRGLRVILLAAALLALSASAAPAAMVVTGYNPARMDSGTAAEVTIQGRGFGQERRDRCVWYGEGVRRIRRAALLSWSGRAVAVRMPATAEPGTYWIAIFGPSHGDCVDPKSNYLETFVVRERRPEFPDGGGGRGADRRDLAIVAVTPGIGTTVTPIRGKIDVTIKVRNRGFEAQTFALTDGRPRVRGGPFGMDIPAGSIETTPSTRLAPGGEAEATISFPVGGDQDAFTRRRVWIVNPGMIPMPFMDETPRDNEATIWYRLQASAYVVKARVEDIRVEDDCDNVSPGEWVFRISGRIRGREGGPTDRSQWPLRAVTTVSSGERLNPMTLNVTLPGVRENESVIMQIHAMDCDAALLGDHLVALFSGIEDICNGEEENQELSGSHDFPGEVLWVLTPAQWRAGGTFGGWSGRGDCGSNAYHADIVVTSAPDF